MENFFPEILIQYLLPFRQAFSKPGFGYFQGFIAALLLSQGRKCISHIANTCFFIDKSLSSWERFLASAQWDLPQVTQHLIGLLIKQLGQALLYAGRYVVAVDTTFAQKVKGRMQGVQRWTENSQNPKRKTSVVGHHWGIAGLLHRIGQRWQCWPVMTKLISGQNHPCHFVVDEHGQAARQTFWDAVLALVLSVSTSLVGAPVVVVADAYFGKAPFLNPLIAHAIGVVSRLRWDAVGFDDPIYCGRGRRPKKGKKWKLAQLLEQFPRQTVVATIYGKTVEMGVVVRDIWLRDVKKKVRIVVFDGVNRPMLLVSTALSLTAGQIIEIYAARFALEIAIRDLKQHLGFCDYQSTTTIAFLRFTQLCCCALCIGRLILSQKESLPWLQHDPSGAVSESAFSFATLRRGLRRFVVKRLLFNKSAESADLNKCQKELDAIVRIAA